MTPTQFVMRLALSPTSYIDVSVTGTGLRYDLQTGMIRAGEVTSVAMTTSSGAGKVPALLDVRQMDNLNIEATKLAETFGAKFWNEAKLLADKFEKLTSLHEGVTFSYFAKGKTFSAGSDLDDAVTGSRFNDVMHGQGGDDSLLGGAGNDALYGDAGDDVLSGDAGKDMIFDRDGNNQLLGGVGDDVLRGGAGIDVLDGGKGSDILYGGGGYDWARGDVGIDRFVFSLKDAGKLTITDFSAEDVLVNLVYGARDEAFEDFITHAHQSGRNVVYDNGETHVVLKSCQMDQLHIENFGDAGSVGVLDLF